MRSRQQGQLTPEQRRLRGQDRKRAVIAIPVAIVAVALVLFACPFWNVMQWGALNGLQQCLTCFGVFMVVGLVFFCFMLAPDKEYWRGYAEMVGLTSKQPTTHGSEHFTQQREERGQFGRRDKIMYCTECGKQLPNDANFCLNCGTPIKQSTKPSNQSEQQWEYCEISYKTAGGLLGVLGTRGCFIANAVGSRGMYIAAQSTTTFDSTYLGHESSEPVPLDFLGNPHRERAKAALNEVVTQLSSDGWQPAGKGEEWWRYKFRRQLSS